MTSGVSNFSLVFLKVLDVEFLDVHKASFSFYINFSHF